MLKDRIGRKVEPFHRTEDKAVRRKVEPFHKRKDRNVIVIPPRRVVPLKPVMYQCGECGAMFERGRLTWYSCSRPACPVFPQVYMWDRPVHPLLRKRFDVLCGMNAPDGMDFGRAGEA